MNAPATEQKLTSTDLVKRLRARYEYPEWLVADEVTLEYQHKTFRADAMAVNLWVSRGLHLHGFEVKVTRSDWLKELQSVGKCEAARRFCDRWWLVSPPQVAVREELPEGWGWIQTSGEGLRIAKQAAQNETPDKMTPELVVRLLRAACEKSPVAVKACETAARESAAVYERAKKDLERQQQYDTRDFDRVKEENERLNAKFYEFQQASGIDMSSFRWNGDAKKLGKAVGSLARHKGPESVLRGLVRTLEEFDEFRKRLVILTDEIRRTDAAQEPHQ